MNYRVTLSNYKEDRYYPKVVGAMAEQLKMSRDIRTIDVFCALDLLSQQDLIRWRAGQVPYLESVIKCNLSKAERITRVLGFHAHDLNLGKSLNFEKYKGKKLRFSKSGAKKTEERYASQFSVIGKKNPYSDTYGDQ
jgi:hypothetical protein